MGSLKRSCLVWAMLYLALGALFSALIYARFPRAKVALGAGFGAAIFGWIGLANLAGARYREARLLARGVTGGRPRDGEKVGVVGRIGSSGEIVESPFSKTRCVLYEYKILPVGNDQAGAWEGFHLAAARIDGSRGSIRLLAYPELAFTGENLRGSQYYENAREYVAKTQFTEMDLGRAFSHMKSLLADDDGRIAYDVRRKVTESMESMRLQEKVLEPGDPVCAIGVYSASRGGLVPNRRAILHPIKIIKGDPTETVRKLYRGSVVDLLLGLGCLTPVILAAAIALIVVPLTAIEQMIPEKDPSWPEIRLEQMLQQKVRPKTERWFNVGEPSLVLEDGQATGKLFSAGQATPLRFASANREAGGTTAVWILGEGAPAPGVIVRFRDDNRVQSLEVVGRTTIRDPDVTVENFTRSTEEIAGRVTYLGPEATLRTAFRATVQGR